MTTLAAEPATAPDAPSEPGPWQAVHIFYGAVRLSMLTESIRPLIAGLRQDGLLSSWFFINYWVEGTHLRLRLQPSSEAATETVLERAEAAIDAYLRRRPALYSADPDFLSDVYTKMFDFEFTDEQRAVYLDENGRMRLRENNTHSREPYEPEYGKYGGAAGVAVAEWHFEHSSDLVVDLLRTMNTHLRSIRLGIAAQLMMVTAAAFEADAATCADFFEGYHGFWRRAFDTDGDVTDEDYDSAYDKTGPGISQRFAAVREAFARGAAGSLPGVLGAWAEHCIEVRARIGALAEAGALVFESWDGSDNQVITDAGAAARRLLLPYLHMTNNRLGMTLTDEAFLGRILARALREAEHAAPESESESESESEPEAAS
ncbi:putative lantibiotic biosynthesis protein [Catenulispora acidiphila DSM 44928]|uniref:Putative lantibiotic biosynthesis protein n=1 Tax=Catenulispora acidiphila (strain DSM 44928 / JCM 14897 / NBRC 102108 / NRRL B-24433 / ID139908) TaxID=479433 RepID=C7QI23_CATAD|nr:lantibiotic dehydratase C-terminal domain-containing protein [Catenulispora acidiphila]ACU73068.1 putative lantibiotic biosynthesis protein [Catenulispora acidiphila DSM 44928]